MAEVAVINPDIEVVGAYVNARTPVLHKCKIDGYEWTATPDSVLHGHGCPICAGNKKYEHEEYVKKLAESNPNIDVVEKYISSFIPILHRCKIDECEWRARPSAVLHGSGCPKCAGVERYGHEAYIKKLLNVSNSIEVIGTYINNNTKILHKCKIDGFEWLARPNGILSGQGCPKCKASKGEKVIAGWMSEMNILYEAQKKFNNCKYKRCLPFDFYLPDYNICIEYNGRQHYEPVDYFGGEEGFKIRIKRDQIKEDYCKKNNIMLIQIPYYTDIYEELDKLYELIKTQDLVKEVA